jgi:hypothetical protein
MGVQESDRELLISLNQILMPLFTENRLDGIVGIEFDTAEQSKRVFERVPDDEANVDYLRGCLLRLWQNHRQYLRTMVAKDLVSWARKSMEYGSVKDWRRLLSFLAGNLADPPPKELSSSLRLMVMGLRGPYFDARCNLSKEWDALKEFVPQDHISMQKNNGVSEDLVAKSSWVRTVLATASASALCGGSASVSLERSALRRRSSLRIAVQHNGHKEFGEQGLALARAICNYRGWDYEDYMSELVIDVPNYGESD